MQFTTVRIAAALAFGFASAWSHAAGADQTQLLVGTKQTMRAYRFAPDGNGPYPGILLLHTSGGLRPTDLSYAQALAGQNYVVLVPAFMEAYGITAGSRQATFTTDGDAIYADFVAALDTLEHDRKVNGSKLGAIGFSNGGYFAMWLAATGKVSAGVAYYGAFTGAGTDKGLSRFRSAFTKASAPVLILHGTADGTVPVTFAHDLAEIAQAAGSPVELQTYEGASHQFERTASPQNAAAASDAWSRTLTFFAKYLRGSGS